MGTLNYKPLVGRIAKNKDGDDDFTSHNAKTIYKLENGKLIQSYKFDTDAFGTFYNVSIETIDEVEYIVAKCKVWKRFEKCCEIIQSRAENKEPLATSWEISISDSELIDVDGKQVKKINKGVFIGHALLSKYTSPAYDSSGMLEVAELHEDIELANAIIEDLNMLNAECISEDNVIQDIEGGNKMSKQNIEVSAMNTSDLRSKVARAIYATEGNGRYYYGIIVYPYDYAAYAKLETQNSNDDDYTKFTFTINTDGENETVSITSQEDVKMVFVSKSENEAQLAELQKQIDDTKNELSQKETELSEKVEEIIKLGETIKTHETTISEKEQIISELEPFKAQIEKAQLKEKEAEIAEKKKELKNMAISSKYFTEEELETSEELKKAIDELDEKAVKLMIAEKVVANATKIENKETDIVMSSDMKNISVDINTENNYNYSTSDNLIEAWIKKQNKKY